MYEIDMITLLQLLKYHYISKIVFMQDNIFESTEQVKEAVMT